MLMESMKVMATVPEQVQVLSSTTNQILKV